MSLFNIKLKTKAGNDIKKKETFTCLFRVKYKKKGANKKITAEYTYRLFYSKGVEDPQRVLQLKNSHLVGSIEDLTLKVMLNFCHIIGNITKAHNIDPDFILFMSPDFENSKSKAWMFLNDAFRRPKKEEKKKIDADNPFDWLNEYTEDFERQWTEERCKTLNIKKEELNLLKSFADLNPNTMFMTIDPNRDKQKYAKSIHICSMLQDRIDRNLQITENPIR
jgi:hypothetical protein